MAALAPAAPARDSRGVVRRASLSSVLSLLSLLLAACGQAGTDAVVDARRDGPVDADDGDGGDGGDPFACVPAIGDLQAAPELIAIRSGDPDGVELTDGAVVPMMAPPQGGIILLVGVRAKNVDGCALQLTAALRDPGTNQVIAIESRPAQLRLGGGGWGVPVESQFFSMANLAVCPAAAATRDVFDQPWLPAELAAVINSGYIVEIS